MENRMLPTEVKRTYSVYARNDATETGGYDDLPLYRRDEVLATGLTEAKAKRIAVQGFNKVIAHGCTVLVKPEDLRFYVIKKVTYPEQYAKWTGEMFYD